MPTIRKSSRPSGERGIRLSKRRKQKFISLNFKMTIVVLIGIALALGMYLFCSWFTGYVTQIRYLSDEAVSQNVGEAYDSLERFIRRGNVKATDSKALTRWIKDQDYTYFFVYDNYKTIFEAGWWVNADSAAPDSALKNEESTLYENVYTDERHRIDEETFTTDVNNRIIEFADGKYYVFIDVYKEQHWQDIMELVTLILCFLTLLITILLYNGSTLKRVGRLAAEVRQVSDGKLDNTIHAIHNDEIGMLAASVDDMRNSIIQKHQNEKEAWDANTQLITAMSHDIRTPLTSMIGYLDIIEGKKYDSEEQMEKYIHSCREKAFQLKDLSDQLFRYFLVFGNHESEKELESLDASILFQQLLAEHSAEIISYGYKVDLLFTIPTVNVRTDISNLKRLFDNIFSNIMKYATKKKPVSIRAEFDGEGIEIEIRNGIWEQSRKVESTHIGMKTCQRICEDLKGEFSYEEVGDDFVVDIWFPAVPAEEEPESETADDGNPISEEHQN